MYQWKLITDNRYILEVTVNGNKIPFKANSDDSTLSNNRPALDNYDFVIKEIEFLLNTSCMKEVQVKPS